MEFQEQMTNENFILFYKLNIESSRFEELSNLCFIVFYISNSLNEIIPDPSGLYDKTSEESLIRKIYSSHTMTCSMASQIIASNDWSKELKITKELLEIANKSQNIKDSISIDDEIDTILSQVYYINEVLSGNFPLWDSYKLNKQYVN